MGKPEVFISDDLTNYAQKDRREWCFADVMCRNTGSLEQETAAHVTCLFQAGEERPDAARSEVEGAQRETIGLYEDDMVSS